MGLGVGTEVGPPAPGHTCLSAHAILNHRNKERRKKNTPVFNDTCTHRSPSPHSSYSGTLDRLPCELRPIETRIFTYSAHVHTYINASQHVLGRNPDLRMGLEGRSVRGQAGDSLGSQDTAGYPRSLLSGGQTDG